MKINRSNGFAKAITRYFQDYLPTLRGMSIHTIYSYRDAILLFLRFICAQNKKSIEKLEFDDFTAKQVELFLGYLEKERHNQIATRNARLSALHTLARFIASEQPEWLGEMQRILGIPFKRGAQQEPIEYLEKNEVATLLGSIDQTTALGKRDYALFSLMFNTGARVQEILDLSIQDVRTEPPYQVKLKGKGKKIRFCPIWSQTVKLLIDLAQQSPLSATSNTPLFKNQRGGKLTRFGVRYLLNKYIKICREKVNTLKEKRIHPHSLRHTTAISLLKAGVDFATISQWMGHASLNTTMNYARADIDLKRKALAQLASSTNTPTNSRGVGKSTMNIDDWLKRL